MSAIARRGAPGVRVTLLADEHAREGEPLDLADRLMSFSFEDAERRVDKATFQLDNHDLALFDDEALMGGRMLEVSWGYPGHLSIPRRVVVRSVKGFEALTIEGRALSVLMDRVARTRSWTGMTRAQVARAIAAEYGYEGAFVDVQETEEVLDTIAQTGETDARFLRRLAAREEFELYVDDGGFHFHERRQSAAPTQVLTWYADPGRGELMSVSVESDLVRRVGRVTVRGRDPLNRTTIEEAATNETTDRDTLAELTESIDPDAVRIDPETGELKRSESVLDKVNATESVRATAAGTPSRARREAQARFRRAERATVKLTLKTVGDPTLHAKSIIELRGISSMLSGLYYVTSVKHTIDGSGYVCELKATRDGTGRRARALVVERRGAGRRQAQPEGDDRPETGGEHNRSQASADDGSPQILETLDGETGDSILEFLTGGQSLGAGDPEGPR